MFERSGGAGGQNHRQNHLAETATALRERLADAQRRLAAGEVEEAAAAAKAVSVIAKAARDLADLDAIVVAQAPEEDEDALRAEIRSRIARFVEAERRGDPDAALEGFARETFGG